MSEAKTFEISPEQVALVARKGVTLLQNDDLVRLPPSMSIDGSYSLLVQILGSLGSGQVVLANPEVPEPPEGEKTE